MELYFGSTVASINELRATFPADGNENLLMLPQGAASGFGWPFPDEGMWATGNWDDLRSLFEAMASRNEWFAHETNSNGDELRDTCLVHHFHLDGHRRPRSSYRWFAFRDPSRFGNLWFNLGGTDKSLDELRDFWTGREWMVQIKRLYPWVAAKYRIRGNPGIPVPSYIPRAVRQIRHHEPNHYPVVQVDDDIYLCAGGRARALDLDRCAAVDRWSVYVTGEGMFATIFDQDPENMLLQIADARKTADRLTGFNGGTP